MSNPTFRQRFQAVVDAKRLAHPGMTQSQAVSEVIREQPKLHEAVLLESNRGRPHALRQLLGK